MNEEIGSSGEMMGDGCGDRAKIALGLGEGWRTSAGKSAAAPQKSWTYCQYGQNRSSNGPERSSRCQNQ